MNMSELYRNLHVKVDKLLGLFPVVLILGARQCGKTTLSKQIRPQWQYFDLEKSKDRDFISRDYDFFFREHPKQLIIDEAQELPQLFKELRGIIDANRSQKNRFILTGSSSPELIRGASDSLAGRVAIVELGSLKVNEYYQYPLPRFYQIFSESISAQTIDYLRSLKRPPVTHSDISEHFLRGGYPEPRLADNDSYYETWMENYLETYVGRDIRKLFPKLALVKYQRFIGMLSSLSGTIINRSEVGRSLDSSEVTVRDYLEIAHQTYIWRNLLSYEKSLSRSIVKMPKGIFRDSGLAHSLQNIFKREALQRFPYVGASFESFVIEEVIKGIQATDLSNWHYWYYRTKNGAEVDLILEGPFGIVPIEIKYGTTTNPRQITGLKRFINTNHLPLGLLINNSEEIELIADKIVQIPVQFI